MNNICIVLKVGGTMFETTLGTMTKSQYLSSLIIDYMRNNSHISSPNMNIEQHTFVINRMAHIFKHVLALMIDENYGYPKKYLSELDFYGVEMNVEESQKIENINKTDLQKLGEDQVMAAIACGNYSNRGMDKYLVKK